jgi:hypothetical protein
MSLFRSRDKKEQKLELLLSQYDHLSEVGPVETWDKLLGDILKIAPEIPEYWFDYGLLAKRRRDWYKAIELNQKVLTMRTQEQDPAAWNLGIAATAIGDWERARWAWQRYGIELAPVTDPTEPIMDNFEQTPVRLNPEPRYLGDTTLTVDGVEFGAEVVWAQRLCPARALILNVPDPSSGHCFKDIVLHDGEPVGSRFLNGTSRAVFNELALLERSSWPTTTVTVTASPEAIEELGENFLSRGYGLEDWSQSMQILCRTCSESDTPSCDHDEDKPKEGPHRIGIGAPPEDIGHLINEWQMRAADRYYEYPEVKE